MARLVQLVVINILGAANADGGRGNEFRDAGHQRLDIRITASQSVALCCICTLNSGPKLFQGGDKNGSDKDLCMNEIGTVSWQNRVVVREWNTKR